ncbi:hypothetical protein ACWCYZ_41205 [Streptomyces virginiae]
MDVEQAGSDPYRAGDRLGVGVGGVGDGHGDDRDVAWGGAGRTGTIATTRRSATVLAIGELQVLDVT